MPRKKVEGRRNPETRRQEFAWIDWLRGLEGTSHRREFPITIGDDAAVWMPKPGQAAVLTVDAQVEGVHFRREWMSLSDIGQRAVTAGVSDLAAMGARPRLVLVSTVLASDTSARDFRKLHQGIRKAASVYGATVVGGNLSSGPMAIHIMAIGEGRLDRLLKRSGARTGDFVWVTGSPGLAQLGHAFLSRAAASNDKHSVPPRAIRPAIRAFRRPTARVAEARYLTRYRSVGGVIDVSDGLASDVNHILTESSRARGISLGAELEAAALARLPRLPPASRCLGASALDAALFGGEAYELCFTAAPSFTPRRAADLQRRIGTSLTRIGRITGGSGIVLCGADGTRTELSPEMGWDHFGAGGES